MASVCFYFQVHQPWRVKRFRIFDIGHGGRYFDDHSKTNLNNEKIFRKVAEKSYLPANEVMLSLLTTHPEFRISYSLSGVLMEQMESFGPDVLDSFQRLVDTGRAELLSETYYHSLSFLYSREEFAEQVKLHRDKVRSLFGVTPKVFRNTELIFNNDLAQAVAELGYSAVLAEGADHVLGWRSPNFLYTPKGAGGIKLLLKNYKLSDDIAFRFGERSWKEFPLTAPKFAQWVNAINGNGNVVNLFMDYETFGEHQWEDTGIFKFMESLPREILKHPDNDFVTVSEAAERYAPVAELDIPHYVSWADTERDLSAWLSNEIQHDAISKLYALEGEVKGSGNRRLVEDWRRLTTSDHFYYMCTKWWNDGDVHKYFNPYESPYDAFISYMNVLEDLKLRLAAK
ncbi:MAG TPA: alpha-amylase [Candidatus Vogelbacteria bacterium]|uniref:Alpha-amylase n=1 Tax=Candidatus Vogelbacteria bacterium RIFOXYD1_FULL_51_18 TaxID=1802440 RepID=A0A1G2QL74_9BACT|nr:MAG: Glycosyl hydrolase family 57 [Parcubacteria group bacterium GW2011_GWF2_52_12]KKW27647.1 MAG: Glycosyl hydrolase family 57 [Parcubacteria group bacterium GW2011_GWF1_52_5]OHA61228.1 MAG: alpha-amylase [Candidatus Vogelbacteria bacterium RIFOXYD1_FULL_51_18]HBB65457.1 alpha-amylase [Candidatus Vogelbacteria bacterium]HBC44537.1 alpha-amylase [Candidatus Vogelbacteria bacterium]